MEDFQPIFPRYGRFSSTLWKTALFLLLGGFFSVPVRAALPDPPPLPFPLPATNLRIRQTTTVFAPDNYLHLATLDRPLAAYEIDDLSATLTRLGWSLRLTHSAGEAAVLQQLRALAPTAELQQPFVAALQMLETGLQFWSLDTIQLIYTPGDNATLGISFPLTAADLPAHPGAFTADLPLPLHDALFSQAAIQADDQQITRMETWHSHTSAELFLNQTESLLIAAGWASPIPATPPPAHPDQHAAVQRLLAKEQLLKNIFRVYHRGNAQLSLFHAPAASADFTAPPHAYTLVLRTLLQWPTTPPTMNLP